MISYAELTLVVVVLILVAAPATLLGLWSAVRLDRRSRH